MRSISTGTSDSALTITINSRFRISHPPVRIFVAITPDRQVSSFIFDTSMDVMPGYAGPKVRCVNVFLACKKSLSIRPVLTADSLCVLDPTKRIVRVVIPCHTQRKRTISFDEKTHRMIRFPVSNLACRKIQRIRNLLSIPNTGQSSSHFTGTR